VECSRLAHEMIGAAGGCSGTFVATE
jgi:hypothetical protein